MISGENNVASGKEKSSDAGPLGLSGDQYWNDPTSFIEDIIDQRMMTSQDGFLIDAPGKVFLDQNKTVPLVCLHTAETNKFVRHSLMTTTQLISVYLETGDVRLVKLAESPAMRDTRQHPPGFSNRSLAVDLKELLSIGSYPGRHAVSLLCGPEISNTCIIEIIPGRGRELVDDYQRQIAALRKEGPPLSLDQTYAELHIKQHLPINVSDGKIVWSVTQTKEGSSDFRIKLMFSIPGLQRFLFREKRPLDPEGKEVVAALPVALVGFNEERALVIFKKFPLPIIAQPAGDMNNPILSGNTSFLLSSFVEPGGSDKKLSLWCISMECASLVELDFPTANK